MSLTCWTTLPWLRGAPTPSPGPQVSAVQLPFPEEGVAAWPRSCPAGRGARKLEGEPVGGGEAVVTWANLPQGNEVSSRLLGGDGGGRIRPRLTQAGRGISPRSLQPGPLPPPPPGRSREPARSRGSRPAPCLPQRPGFLSVPASLPPLRRPASRNCPPWGGAEGRGGCHPMGSRLAAKRRGSRGRRRARCAHLTAQRVRRSPPLPRAPPARTACGRRAPHVRTRQGPPGLFASRAHRDSGRGALRSLPPLPPPEQGVRVASPPAAALHNRGGDACPAAAGAGRFTWPGLGPPLSAPPRARPGHRDRGGGAPRGAARRRVRSARRAGGAEGSVLGGGRRASCSPLRCALRAAGCRDTDSAPEFTGSSGKKADWATRGRQPEKIISGPLAGREKR